MVAISITPLLKLLAAYQEAGQSDVSEDIIKDVEAAFAAILSENEVSDTQRTALFTALTFTNLYHHSGIVNAVVRVMRQAAVQLPIDFDEPAFAQKRARLTTNDYQGGFVCPQLVTLGGCQRLYH